MRLRRLHLWVVLLCVVAGAGLIAAANAGAVTSAQCDARVNDTPGKLLPCIQKDDLWKHMVDFQAIADTYLGPDGHPSRNSGEPGYAASVAYVADLMSQWGYDVKVQTYTFDYFAYTGIPALSEVSPNAHSYVLNEEWSSGQSLGSVTADLQPSGGFVLPPTPESSSTSGCTPADFTGFTPGRIALIQRGGCNYGVKVLNAEAAGASGVIIFNEVNPGRTDLIFGSLFDAAGNPFTPNIPVAFTSFPIGIDLLS